MSFLRPGRFNARPIWGWAGTTAGVGAGNQMNFFPLPEIKIVQYIGGLKKKGDAQSYLLKAQ